MCMQERVGKSNEAMYAEQNIEQVDKQTACAWKDNSCTITKEERKEREEDIKRGGGRGWKGEGEEERRGETGEAEGREKERKKII